MAPKGELAIAPAKHVYVLLTDKYRISRNIRAQWYLSKLNKCIQFNPVDSIDAYQNELDIVSFVPNTEANPRGEFSKNQFCIVPETQFSFLSRKYSFVFILDLSISVANIDIQHSSVLTDELYFALETCFSNLVKAFKLPGNRVVFEPEILITVLVYMPFYLKDINNVIVHGYKLCPKNIDSFYSLLNDRLHSFITFMQEKIESMFANQNKAEQDGIEAADYSLVNIIRFGLLALDQMTENSHQSIILITDGNISFPNSISMEMALGIFRSSMITFSFVQIGSPPHPDSSFGYVPYNDFMKFLSKTTFGSYLMISPGYKSNFVDQKLNLFHQAFLVWNFHYAKSSFTKELRKNDWGADFWWISNAYFYSDSGDQYINASDRSDQTLLRKSLGMKPTEASFQQIFSDRLREGFTIKEIQFNFDENKGRAVMVLPWRHNINIEYIIYGSFCCGDFVEETIPKNTFYEVLIECYYSFLDDYTSAQGQRTSSGMMSQYRSSTIKQFDNTLRNFRLSDEQSKVFYEFTKSEAYRNIPPGIRDGHLPLYYLPPNENVPVLFYNENEILTKFCEYWHPICLFVVSTLYKTSLHSHQINIIFNHDLPLPEFIFMPNPSGQYDNIQCQKAISVLHQMLKDWCSFVLLENQCYIKLIEEQNNVAVSCSFALIKLISMSPGMVMQLMFIGGTSGYLRNRIVCELKNKLKECKLPQRNLSVLQAKVPSPSIDVDSDDYDSDAKHFKPIEDVTYLNDLEAGARLRTRNESKQDGVKHCFVLLSRSFEHTLIRYEKTPQDLFSCYHHEQSLKQQKQMYRALTRFLSHKRFIWCTQDKQHLKTFEATPTSRILTALALKRIHEGFHIAYNYCGMINLVNEVKMINHTGDEFPCLIQYIIFPANLIRINKDNLYTEEPDEDSHNPNSEHLFVTECWVEPQNGHVVGDVYLEGLESSQILSSFYENDVKLIEMLNAFESLLTIIWYEPDTKTIEDDLYQHFVCAERLNNIAAAAATTSRAPPSEMGTMHEDRFNYRQFHFNLFTLLPNSEFGLIQFPMINQNFPADHRIFNANKGPADDLDDYVNMVLYLEFLLKLYKYHNKEIQFCHLDTYKLIELLNTVSWRKDDNRRTFEQLDAIKGDASIRFKCFCKTNSNNFVYLTIVPFTYEVMLKLAAYNRIENADNMFINKLEQRDGGDFYGSLLVPIFIFKLSFSSFLSLTLDESVPPKPCFYRRFALNENGKYSLLDNFNDRKNVFSLLHEELTLAAFGRNLEVLYWNSFTDAIYKSFRFGIGVNTADAQFALTQVSSRVFEQLDVTRLLLFTCNHIKSLMNVYLGHHPDQNIYSFIAKMRDNRVTPEDYKELSILKSIIHDRKQCSIDIDSLTRAFLKQVCTNFTAVPGFPKEYYFYNYDNIELNKFQLNTEDIKKNRIELHRFYKCFENKCGNLAKFYKVMKKFTIKLASKNNANDVDDLGSTDDNHNEEEYRQLAKELREIGLVGFCPKFLSILLTKPCFLGYSYSLTIHEPNSKLYKTDRIPTCLFDILKIFKNYTYEDIEIPKIKIYLTIEIITQNDESSIMLANNKKAVYGKIHRDGGLNNHKSHTVEYLENLLDKFQAHKFVMFTNQIDWLVTNEIISLSHNSYPICTQSLEHVIEHVERGKSIKSENCFIERIGIKFLFYEEFINTFTSLLSKITFSSYRLRQLDEYFYVVYKPAEHHHSGDKTCKEQTAMMIDLRDDLRLFTASAYEDRLDYIPYLVFNDEYFNDFAPLNQDVAEIPKEDECSLSPNFWLVLTLNENEEEEEDDFHQTIIVYFHSRQNLFLCDMPIYQMLRRSIDDLAKTTNQKYLLERMYNRRLGEDLLVPATDVDIFLVYNPHVRTIESMVSANKLSSKEQEAEMEFKIEKGLSSSTFASGSFACSIVWQEHFTLHPRFFTAPLKDRMMSFINSLIKAKVEDRENLYVYKEDDCDSVFYMRIYVLDCLDHEFSEQYNHPCRQCNCLEGSSVPSVDKDKEDTVSVSISLKQNFTPQCILLNVHGIAKPSVELRKEMVSALQKKLDDTLLDHLVFLLSRNPLVKLTHEDVCFIQSRNSKIHDFYFKINPIYTPYIANLKAYIRQNLLKMMFNPKFADSDPDHHFKRLNHQVIHRVKDQDVFILLCPEVSGKGTQGLAAVILSIVSKDKSISKDVVYEFVVTKNDHQLLTRRDYSKWAGCRLFKGDDVSDCKLYVHFQVWHLFKAQPQQPEMYTLELGRQLSDSICNALWDFNLEFKVLKFNIPNNGDIKFLVGRDPDKPLDLSKGSIFRQVMAEAESSLQLAEEVDDRIQFNNETTDTEQSESVSDVDEQQQQQGTSLDGEHLHSIVKPWLDFGHTIQAPSLSKHTFSFVLKNSIAPILKEFRAFVDMFSWQMHTQTLTTTDKAADVNTTDWSRPMFIVLRHANLWNAKYLHGTPNSFTNVYCQLSNAEAFNRKQEVQMLTFEPTFLLYKMRHESASNFVSDLRNVDLDTVKCLAPRQKFMMLYVAEHEVTLYLYNWENSSSMIVYLANLVLWHNARSLLLQSLVLQKAGIFHNLPFKRTTYEALLKLTNINAQSMPQLIQLFKDKAFFATNNIFGIAQLLLKYNNPGEADRKYQEELKMDNGNATAATSNNGNSSTTTSAGDGRRNLASTAGAAAASSTAAPYKRHASSNSFIFDSKIYSLVFSPFCERLARGNNYFECFDAQFNSSVIDYYKDLDYLAKVWQKHGSKMNLQVMNRITKHVMKYGRLNHYCLTPFLFNPRWRYTISRIRNHSLMNVSRGRHASNIYPLQQRTLDIGGGGNDLNDVRARNRRKSGPPNIQDLSNLARTGLDEKLDIAMCSNYIKEYVQYLQSLGFSSIKSQRGKSLIFKEDETAADFDSNRKMEKFKLQTKLAFQNEFEKIFLVKTLQAGFFLFEIGFSEPYVYSYLYAFDSKRIDTFSSSRTHLTEASVVNFLDELESIKVRIHLHSFTYDYHLRRMHTHLSETQTLFYQGYHLVLFLEDFIRYYQKAPNYARSSIYADCLQFKCSMTSDQVYNYLTVHAKDYGMKVFQMDSPLSILDQSNEPNREYLLVKLTTSELPYFDEKSEKQEEKFDISLLITNNKQKNMPVNNLSSKLDNILYLKFFLIITSQRELFPKLMSYLDDANHMFKTIRPMRPMPSVEPFEVSSVSRASSFDEALENYNNNVDTDAESVSSQNQQQQRQRQPSPATNKVIMPPITPTFRVITLPYICDERITYTAYYNAHELLMKARMKNMIEQTKQRLTRQISEASIDCRRDYLWSHLLPPNLLGGGGGGNMGYSTPNEQQPPSSGGGGGGGSAIAASATNAGASNLTMDEFNELLSLVKSISLPEYDATLIQLLHFNAQWYKWLAHRLEIKFDQCCRKFAKDNNVKVIFYKNNCKDCFILLDINTDTRNDIRLVFNQSRDTIVNRAFFESCNPVYHELVENFVNACAYQMWCAQM